MPVAAGTTKHENGFPPNWLSTGSQFQFGLLHAQAPLCGNDAVTTVFTDDPALVAGCADCLELAAEDLV